jgi:hypothetical protein
LVIALVLVFVAIAAQRIWELRVAAEETAVAQVIGAIRTGLGHRVLGLSMRGQISEIARLQEADPAFFLERAPSNYEVLREPLAPEAMRPYRWYFDPASRILTYRVGNEREFASPLGAPARIRLQVQVEYADNDRNGRFDEETDTLFRVNLVALESFRWRSP